MSATAQIDWCEDQLGHRGVHDLVLYVQPVDLTLVGGEDDIIVIETCSGHRS